MAYLTLSDTNAFSFKCPVFGADTKMASCVKLRNMVWMGKRPEQRRGCQACMQAGKCPAAQIVQRMAMSNPRSPVGDDYGSEEPKAGKLRRELLERILPVIVPERLFEAFSVSTAERNAIETANTRISAMLGTAPAESKGQRAEVKGSGAKAVTRKNVRTRTATPEAPETSDKVRRAAETGDMGAALE